MPPPDDLDSPMEVPPFDDLEALIRAQLEQLQRQRQDRARPALPEVATGLTFEQVLPHLKAGHWAARPVWKRLKRMRLAHGPQFLFETATGLTERYGNLSIYDLLADDWTVEARETKRKPASGSSSLEQEPETVE